MTFVDSDGYLGYMSYGNLMSGKRNQYVSKFNPHSVENIRHFLALSNEGTTLLSDTYINSDSLLEFQCKCGKTFERSWNNLKQQAYTCCSDCAIIQRGIQHRMSFDIVKDVFAQNGYTLVDTEHSYCRNNSYLECIDSDGYRGFQSYAHIQQRGDSISKFSTLKNTKSNVVYNINVWASKNNIRSRCLDFADEDRWTNQGIICQCTCGKMFSTSIPSFMNGKNVCDDCAKSVSSIEKKTKAWLDEHNINYTRQYRFDDCRNILSLPFDFYIEDKNLVIEVDGEGHYHIAHFNQCSYESAHKTFELTKYNDNIKTRYCIERGIKLLRIPYWAYQNDDYQNILNANLIED
jgi:very-short-patch-repair endonuclease